MATTPDPHPDSFPSGPSEAPDQISPPSEPGRESVEDVPGGDNSTAVIDVAELIRAERETGEASRTLPDSAGDFAGTGGTGGYVKGQDE